MVKNHTEAFRLVRIEREELIVQCKRDDYDVWGAPDLTLSEYQAEELLQRRTTHSQRGLMVWGLVARGPTPLDQSDLSDADVVAGQDAVVCHCESHRFDCMLCKPSGHVVQGYSFHVNAVYTLPAFRKQGLARFFLQQVVRQLAWQENAVASVLYSDIGPTFYARLGWEVHCSTEAVVDVAASLKRTTVQAEEDNRNRVNPLFLNKQLDDLLALEHARLQQSLLQRNGEVFAALPTRACLEWHFCSGVLHAYVRQYAATPAQCGVQVADAFVLWTHDFRASVLYVLYTHIPEHNASVALALVREALAEADRFGLAQIRVWDPPAILTHPLVTAHVSIAVRDRTDGLSSLLVFKHVRDDPNVDVRPTWLHNERFAWV